MTSYAILGVGAVGGYYGARLAAAGHDVHFIARSDLAHVREHGLRVESPHGDVHLRDVQVWASPAECPPVDVGVVGLKGGVPNPAAALVGALRAEAVLTLQNGLGIEDELAPVVGARPLLGGLCFICSNKVGPGHVRHLDYGAITLGQHGGRSDAADRIAADLTAAGIPVTVEDDLVLARWKKLGWNVPFNGLSVVLDALPGELLADEHGRALVVTLMAEVQAGAAACGRAVPDEFFAGLVASTEHMAPYKTSMKLDFEAGRPLEVETILGNPVRAARAAGVELPAMEALYRQVAWLDARHCR